MRQACVVSHIPSFLILLNRLLRIHQSMRKDWKVYKGRNKTTYMVRKHLLDHLMRIQLNLRLLQICSKSILLGQLVPRYLLSMLEHC